MPSPHTQRAVASAEHAAVDDVALQSTSGSKTSPPSRIAGEHRAVSQQGVVEGGRATIGGWPWVHAVPGRAHLTEDIEGHPEQRRSMASSPFQLALELS